MLHKPQVIQMEAKFPLAWFCSWWSLKGGVRQLSHGFFCNLCHNTWGLCNLFLFGSFNLSHGNKEKSILGAELMMCLLNYMFFMPVHSEMWRSLLVPDSSYSITLKGQELQIKPFWFTSFLFLISNLLLVYFAEILNWQEWTKMIGTFCRSHFFFFELQRLSFCGKPNYSGMSFRQQYFSLLVLLVYVL